MTSYHFDIQFLLDLDVISLDRLLEIARRAKNSEHRTFAILTRGAMNAEAKDFQNLLDEFSPESREDVEARKVQEGTAALKKLFGG